MIISGEYVQCSVLRFARSAAGNAARLAPALLCAALLWPAQALAQFAQQGPKLVGNDVVGAAQQGISVAVSADGNTAIVGGFQDDNGGAAWVYTRSGGVWSQAQSKLVSTDAVGNALQGRSVALSADGNIALVGGSYNNSRAGATFVFYRDPSTMQWTQQGSFTGTGVLLQTPAQQGFSVALSADGNTAIVGGPGDDDNIGAAWVFTSGGVPPSFHQEAKLVGQPYGEARGGEVGQGFSGALSADGNTAIVGGPGNHDNTGSAWVYTRSDGQWSQQGYLDVGATVGKAQQGYSVALSADGNTAIVGGPGDNNNVGAAWVYTRSGGVWSQQAQLIGTGQPAHQGTSVALSADGNTAIVGAPAYINTDNINVGAAFIFTRSGGGVWSQGIPVLTGSDPAGVSGQGFSVALGCNTVISGGNSDNNGIGAAWVFADPTFGCLLGH